MAHFLPKRNIDNQYEIHMLRKERQSSSESLDSSVTCLRRRGKYYEFSDFEAELKSQVVQ